MLHNNPVVFKICVQANQSCYGQNTFIVQDVTESVVLKKGTLILSKPNFDKVSGKMDGAIVFSSFDEFIENGDDLKPRPRDFSFNFEDSDLFGS